MEVVWEYGMYGVLLLWAGWQIRRLDINTQRLVGTLSRDSAWIPTVAFLAPVILVFSLGSWLLFYAVASLVAPSVRQFTAEMVSLPIPWILTVLVAPPVEELIFRGILLHRWSIKWGLRKAMILSSLAFAILHMNPIGMFVFGYVMAVLYIRSRTLIAPIACHMLNNALALAAGESLTSGTVSKTSFIAVTAFCTIGAGAWLFYFLRENRGGVDWCAPYFAPSASPLAPERRPGTHSVEGGGPVEHPDEPPHDPLDASERPPDHL
jgi:membrane protease YdiL (CAAX protease family)